MKAWMITNATSDKETAKKFYDALKVECNKFDIELLFFTNVEAYFKTLHEFEKPKFISFWCKDYKLARYFEKFGIRVFNSSRSIEICDDKAKTYIELLDAEVKQPKSIVSPYFYYQDQFDVDIIVNKAIEELGNDIVVKECMGAFGKEVSLVTTKKELKNKILQIGRKPYILQEQIKESFARDIKVEIVGDFYCAMKRVNTNGDFRANLNSGGVGENYKLNEQQLSICRKAIKAVGLDFGGVDLLFGKDDEPIICEVNSNSSFLHIGEVTKTNIPCELVKYMLKLT